MSAKVYLQDYTIIIEDTDKGNFYLSSKNGALSVSGTVLNISDSIKNYKYSNDWTNLRDETNTAFGSQQLAINHVLSIIGIIPTSGGGGGGSVESVNGQTPNESGDVTVTASHISTDDGHVQGDIDDIKLSRLITVYNESGSTISANKLVYINGERPSGIPTIELADNTSASTMNSIGIVSTDIPNDSEGEVYVSGYLHNIDTSGLINGDTLYVGTNGDFTTTKPIGTSLIQNIGFVSRVHASNGSILLTGSGRSNDLPNLPTGYHWVGDENGVPQAVSSSGGSEDSRMTWALTTDVFNAPVIAYGSGDVEINSTGEIELYVLGGTEPIQSFSIVSGSLPSEFTLDSETGIISYTTTAAQSSGSFTIGAQNPAGIGEYVVNYDIKQANGVAQFTNSETPYPFMRITTSNSIDTQVLIKSTFFGRTTSTANGTIIEDSAYPIYVADNGDGTWNYLLCPNGYSYWNLYKNSTTDPDTLANGLVTDITTGALTYDLVAPTSEDVTLNSVKYPSDRSDIHWGTGLNHIEFGTDASLDNFMTDAGSWSYGFRLQEDWLPDGLGRTMFARHGRNWYGVAIGHSSTYSEALIGNGSSTTYDSSEDATLPSNGFASGSYVRVTYGSGTINFYVDGVKYYSYTSANSYLDGVSANSLDIHFGGGVNSNQYQTINSYYHGLWQGNIDRLWIANGFVETTDDDGTTFPTNTTHSWLLNETTGKTFVANTGGIDAEGVSQG